MLQPVHLRQFEKEVAKAKKRGKNIEALKDHETLNPRRSVATKKSQS